MIEVTDNATLRRKRSKTLQAVVDTVCPHPLKFRQVWRLSRGGKALYAWQPQPPDGFVALGMLCTSTDDPPAITTMRCVPLAWCSPSKKPPYKIWDDTGAGGGKPGSIWTINSMDMVAIVPGHDPPTDTFYDLNDKRFFIDSSQLPKHLFDASN